LSIAIDSNGDACVTGYTISFDFPTTPGAYDTAHNGGYDVHVIKVDFKWYWKPPYPNYAPLGMPDFNQKQDDWKAVFPGLDGILQSTPKKNSDDVISTDGKRIAPGPDCKLDTTTTVGDDKIHYAFCSPTAMANCFWWFDSQYADPTGTPGDGKDTFALVTAYPGVVDDHSPGNVFSLIENLAKKLKTCSEGGTNISNMKNGAEQWISEAGLSDKFEVKMYDKPNFSFIANEIEHCRDVILSLGYYDMIKELDQFQTDYDTWDPIQTKTWWDYQSFQPVFNEIGAVQILLMGGPGPIEINLYDISKRRIGRSVGDPGVLPVPTWVQFHFGKNIQVAPNAIYYFDVRKLNENDWYEWAYKCSTFTQDFYTRGQGWMDGNPFTFDGKPFDWAFKTERCIECICRYGHSVTCAGVNSKEKMIAISDPGKDVQNPAQTDHNDTKNVSHDIYNVVIGCPCPNLAYKWWLQGYSNVYDFTIVEEAVIIYPIKYIPSPDLDCKGSLSWTSVTPGATVTGSFIVSNIGDPNSELDWKIDSYPSWGTWTFNPSSGDDLKPSDGPVTIQVSVVAPNQQQQTFTGQVKVVNKEDSSDYCTIPVSLATPRNKPYINPLFLQFLERFLSNHPRLFPILRHLLGL
jgi:hypothetical protein